MSDFERRIARLEAESDIRKLKARYLNACDAKNIDDIRACFTEDAEIVFPPIGSFGLDGLIDIFTQMAASTPIADVHHAHNGEITISGDTAEARWNLGFATYDPRNKSFRMLSSFYEDRYRKTSKGWLISFTKSTPRTIVDGILSEDKLTANWAMENKES